MAGALLHHGFLDAFDAVYGASAGSLVSAYLLSDPELSEAMGIYTNLLTDPSNGFITKKRFWNALGLGALGLPFTGKEGLEDLVGLDKESDPHRLGKPVLNLDFLLVDAIQKISPMNFDKFWKRNQVTPMHLVASGLESGKAVPLSSERGHFWDMKSLETCMRASMLIPGVAGPPVDSVPGVKEPLADAYVYTPIPYHAALDDGATHLLVLRSKPDGSRVPRETSFLERVCMHRFFKRKFRFPRVFEHITSDDMKILYAGQVLELNEAAAGSGVLAHAPAAAAGEGGGGRGGGGGIPAESSRRVPTAVIAAPRGCEEVGTLETTREPMLKGMREGFAMATCALLAGTKATEAGGVAADSEIDPESGSFTFPKSSEELHRSPAMALSASLLT